MAALAALGVTVKIWTMPVEIPSPIRFTEDTVHKSYDADAASIWWRALSVETSDGEVEPAPPEMNRARLPDETRPEIIHDRRAARHDAPPDARGVGVVRFVHGVFCEADRREVR